MSDLIDTPPEPKPKPSNPDCHHDRYARTQYAWLSGPKSVALAPKSHEMRNNLLLLRCWLLCFFFSLYVSKILRMGQQDPGNEHTHHSIDRRWDWSTCTACCTGSQPTKSRDRTTFRSWQILEYRRKKSVHRHRHAGAYGYAMGYRAQSSGRTSRIEREV